MSKENRFGCGMIALGAGMIVPLVIHLTISFLASYHFNKNCGDWLRLAANANSIPLASERVDKAIDYIERNDLVDGNTGVIFKKPSNDLGAWYQNLKAVQENLHSFPENASEADINTTLSKVRESLVDQDESGDRVTLPGRISVFPYNAAWLLSINLCVALSFIGSVIITVGFVSLEEG